VRENAIVSGDPQQIERSSHELASWRNFTDVFAPGGLDN